VVADLANVWITWWVADLIGILVAAPPLLVSRDEWWVVQERCDDDEVPHDEDDGRNATHALQ
jgi:integral membrane sensor domain MASE1